MIHTDIIIRNAIETDLAALLALYGNLNPSDPPPDRQKLERAWAAILTSSGTKVFVGEIAGILVSSCMLAVIPNLTRGASPFAIIENVVTRPDYRRRGLGLAILAAALKTAWELGCYKVMLATGSQRPETLRFYERAGFARGEKTFFQARPRPDGADDKPASPSSSAPP